MYKNWTRFQKWIVVLLAVALLVDFCLIMVLITAVHVSKQRLNFIGDMMEQTAEQHIITEITLNDSIPLNSNIHIPGEITVGIKMVVESEIPFRAEIPVHESMLVPIRIGVKDYIKLDTTILVSGLFYIDVDDTIPLDQKIKLPIFGKNGPNVPVKGNIQLKQSLKANLNELVPVKGLIPIDMLIVDTLSVGVNMKIPVDVLVPVKIPLNTTARISFPEAIPVNGNIPLALTIPVDIPLKESALADYFKKMAKGLRDLTVLKVKAPED